MENMAVGMDEGGVVFAGGPRAIVVSDDDLNWYHWACPLEEVVGLHVDCGLLAVVGDNQLAVSEIRHQGKMWHIMEVKGAACVHIVVGSRVFVGTSEGRLFEFAIRRRRGILERLGLTKIAPTISPGEEWGLVQGRIDTIALGGVVRERKGEGDGEDA